MKKSDKQKLSKIYKDIKDIKIQGATNIAKAAVIAYSISPTNATKKKLLSLRPTEPLLQHVVKKLNKNNEKEIVKHFSFAQEKINNYVLKLVKSHEVIFTHCHSTNVVNALINAKKQGRNFEVYNTETRPLYQGRKTASQLAKANIKVTTFTDSALNIALTKAQGAKKVSKIFLGSDAILKNGDIINKVGSGVIAQIARQNKIPLYIIADSWKFTEKNISLEQRKAGEVWDNAPKHIKIRNPAFEKVPSKIITKIVSELGVLSPKEFVRRARKRN